MNSVLVITSAAAKAEVHYDLSRQELAEFVLGLRAASGDVLTELNNVMDRSHLMPQPPAAEQDAAKTLDKVQDSLRGESEH